MRCDHKVVPVSDIQGTIFKYFTTYDRGNGVLKVKTKSMLHIYILPLFDWYQVKKYRLSRFGGDATTKWYVSEIQRKI